MTPNYINFEELDEILNFLPKDMVDIIFGYYYIECIRCRKNGIICRECEYEEWACYWGKYNRD